MTFRQGTGRSSLPEETPDVARGLTKTRAALTRHGPRRLEAVAASFADRSRSTRGRGSPAVILPPVEELLDVDREYRERAAAGTLPRIAPRRLNPAHEAWLPILHTTRGTRRYTALYSNTPRAHEQHTTRDWVVLRFDHDGSPAERQCTVITARYGALAGHRLVRGREDECLRLVRRRAWDAAIEAARAARAARAAEVRIAGDREDGRTGPHRAGRVS